MRINNALKIMVSQGYLLDQIQGSVCAFGLTKLKNGSTLALRVRRSNDNAEQDIGFVNGQLDTTSLLSFCGSNSGFVTKWYDQSGFNNHALQTTQANQPRIVNAGVVDDGLYFNGTAYWMSINDNSSLNITNAPLSMYSNFNSQITANGYIFCRNLDSSANMQYGYYHDLASMSGYSYLSGAVAVTTGSNTILNNTNTKLAFTWNGSVATPYVNAVQKPPNAKTGTLLSSTITTIGARGNTSSTKSVFYKGNIKSIMLFNTCLTQSQLQQM